MDQYRNHMSYLLSKVSKVGKGEINGNTGNSLEIKGTPDIKNVICFYHLLEF